MKRTEVTSDTLRGMVHDHRARCIAVSQLTTESGKKPSQRSNPPTEYDLYGGGKWAQDASQVLLIDHTSKRALDNGTQEIKMLLRKNRHGPKGHWFLHFDTNTLRMTPTHEQRTTPGSADPFSYG